MPELARVAANKDLSAVADDHLPRLEAGESGGGLRITVDEDYQPEQGDSKPPAGERECRNSATTREMPR
ncbi:MAG: hypothetical protein M3428_00550 [Pseudomonadota bacterium]|nr:hypothetical protein [Pseudomonadota bacterium]